MRYIKCSDTVTHAYMFPYLITFYIIWLARQSNRLVFKTALYKFQYFVIIIVIILFSCICNSNYLQTGLHPNTHRGVHPPKPSDPFPPIADMPLFSEYFTIWEIFHFSQ